MRMPLETVSSLGFLASQSQPHSRQGSLSSPSCVLTLSATRDPDARGQTGGAAEPDCWRDHRPRASAQPGKQAGPRRYATAKELSPKTRSPSTAAGLAAPRAAVTVLARTPRTAQEGNQWPGETTPQPPPCG